jgi:hypothetical protein
MYSVNYVSHVCGFILVHAKDRGGKTTSAVRG